jgi:hypothetical protein
MWHDLQSCTRQLPSALHHHNAQELACHAVIKGSAHPAAHWLVHPHSEPQTALLRPNTIAAQSGTTCRASVSVQLCCDTASNGAATAAHQDAWCSVHSIDCGSLTHADLSLTMLEHTRTQSVSLPTTLPVSHTTSSDDEKLLARAACTW